MAKAATTIHMHTNPNEDIVRAETVAIDLNNEAFFKALLLTEKKQYAEAEKKHLESIEIKTKAFTENSLAVCISLSNLADMYLSWKKYDQARSTANRMLSAAVAIKSNEQQRIAKEILFDIAKASGVTDPNAGLRQNKVLTPTIVKSAPGSVIIEPPSKRCANPNGCPNVSNPSVVLKRCGRCQRIWYCSQECQAASWKEHKKECKKLDD